jgi:hypothetical protein
MSFWRLSVPYVVAHHQPVIFLGLSDLDIDEIWEDILEIIEEELRYTDGGGTVIKYDVVADSELHPIENSRWANTSFELLLKIEANESQQRRDNLPERSDNIRRRVKALFPANVRVGVKLDLTKCAWSSDDE